jgi:hypothetical protein
MRQEVLGISGSRSGGVWGLFVHEVAVRNLRGPVHPSMARFLACGGDTPASPDQVMRPGMPLHSRPLLSSRTGEDY